MHTTHTCIQRTIGRSVATANSEHSPGRCFELLATREKAMAVWLLGMTPTTQNCACSASQALTDTRASCENHGDLTSIVRRTSWFGNPAERKQGHKNQGVYTDSSRPLSSLRLCAKERPVHSHEQDIDRLCGQRDARYTQQRSLFTYNQCPLGRRQLSSVGGRGALHHHPVPWWRPTVSTHSTHGQPSHQPRYAPTAGTNLDFVKVRTLRAASQSTPPPLPTSVPWR